MPISTPIRQRAKRRLGLSRKKFSQPTPFGWQQHAGRLLTRQTPPGQATRFTLTVRSCRVSAIDVPSSDVKVEIRHRPRLPPSGERICVFAHVEVMKSARATLTTELRSNYRKKAISLAGDWYEPNSRQSLPRCRPMSMATHATCRAEPRSSSSPASIFQCRAPAPPPEDGVKADATTRWQAAVSSTPGYL